MIRAILFDCFGVIITDALQVITAELNETNPAQARAVRDVIRAVNRGLLDPREANQQIADLLGMSVEQWRSRIDQGEVKDPHVFAYVRELRKRGFKTALLSNIGRNSLSRRFSEDELKTHFDVVVASGEVGLIKPEPEIYLHTAKLLEVTPAECVMVDDREYQCEGARAVGMQSVCYDNFYQAKAALEPLLRQQ